MSVATSRAVAAPTPHELVNELKEIYEATSQEDLARKIDRPVRTVQRWLAGDGMNWDNAIDLLTLTGRLQDGDKARTAADQEKARRVAVRVAQEMQTLAQLL